MSTYVQIVVNVPSVAGVFDYAISAELAGSIGVGQLVIVPFGRQTVQGVVLRFVEQPSVADTKDIIEIVDSGPVLTPNQITLAEWMANETLSPLAAIIKLMLPAGLIFHTIIIKPASRNRLLYVQNIPLVKAG